jgi:hypothetical protein
MQSHVPNLTYFVDLPGGQNRLRQLVIYVADKCQTADRFGGIKLNKILWKADFDAFAARQIPVTGRRYQRERLGPIPKEMLPLRRDMEREGVISIELIDFGDGIIEHRTIPLIPPDLALFSQSDIQFVDEAIRYYWNMTGMESSDDSHGVAWRTRANGEPMPYEASFLSDRQLSTQQRRRFADRLYAEGWITE